jgi:hypothetical protein
MFSSVSKPGTSLYGCLSQMPIVPGITGAGSCRSLVGRPASLFTVQRITKKKKEKMKKQTFEIVDQVDRWGVRVLLCSSQCPIEMQKSGSMPFWRFQTLCPASAVDLKVSLADDPLG